MDQRDKKRLRRNRVYLVDNLEGEKLLDHLYQDEITESEHCERILAQTTSKAKNRTLLDIIVTRGPTAYKKMLKALKATGQSHIIDKLLEEPADEKQAENQSNVQTMNSKEKLWLHAVVEESKETEVTLSEIKEELSQQAISSNEWLDLDETEIQALVETCFPTASFKQGQEQGQPKYVVSGVCLRKKSPAVTPENDTACSRENTEEECNNEKTKVKNAKTKPMKLWNEEQVEAWIKKIGLDDNVVQVFRKERVDGMVLQHLTAEELKTELLLNVPFGVRKRIIICRDDYLKEEKSLDFELEGELLTESAFLSSSLKTDDTPNQTSVKELHSLLPVCSEVGVADDDNHKEPTDNLNKAAEKKEDASTIIEQGQLDTNESMEETAVKEIDSNKAISQAKKEDSSLLYQNFRDFNTRVLPSFKYKQHAQFPPREIRPDNLLQPIHHYVNIKFESMSSREASIAFVAEVLQFACGCINDRTNGTLHLGVLPTESHCGEILGVTLHQPFDKFNEDLLQAVQKGFQDDQQKAALSCIKPPNFIEVKCKGHTSLYVIEIDVIPSYEICKDDAFWVKIPKFNHKKNLVEYGKSGPYRYINGTFKMVPEETLPLFMRIKQKVANNRNEKENRERQFVDISSLDLSLKIKELLCKGGDSFTGDIYPILVVNAPKEHMDLKFMKENFSFLKEIDCKVVFDFDSNARLCQFMDTDNVIKVIPSTDEFDPFRKENQDEQKTFLDDIRYSRLMPWVFTNGYHLLENHRESYNPLQWKQKRSRGMKEAIRFFMNEVPRKRALILFFILSHEYEVMLEAVDDFFISFPDQWIFITEEKTIADPWIEELARRNTMDVEEMSNRTVVGMNWNNLQQTIRELNGPQTTEFCVLPTSQGLFCTLKENVRGRLTDLEILSAKQCENAAITQDKAALADFLKEAETNFYRGAEVSWWNYWSQNHVLVRSQHTDLKRHVDTALNGNPKEEHKVGTVIVYHQPGAGGTTAARQILWDMRGKYRCAIVTNITEDTCHQILQFRDYEDEENPSPVLLLLDNQDEDQANCLLSKLEEQAKQITRDSSEPAKILCVFLICIRQMKVPRRYHSHRVVIRHELSNVELQWFQKKYKELEKNHSRNEGEDPHFLISFNILKENFNIEYINKTAKEITGSMTRDKEKRVLKYVSLLNTFDIDHQPIPTAAFDPIMMTLAEMYTGRPRYGPNAYDPRWESNLSPEMTILLNQTRRAGLGTIQAISVISPLLSKAVFKCLSGKETVSHVMEELLNSRDIFCNRCGAKEQLTKIIQHILKHRRRKEYGQKETKFAPLIQEIVDKETIERATHILKLGYKLTDDPFVAQQIARVYIEAQNWEKATEYAEEATGKSPCSSPLWDTQAQVFKEQLNMEHTALVREVNAKSAQDMVKILDIGFKSIKLFQKEQEVSDYEERRAATSTNLAGYRGEIEVTIKLLKCLHYVAEFKENHSALRNFLNADGKAPNSLMFWKDVDGVDYLEKLWNIKKNVESAMTRLDDEMLQLREETVDDVKRSPNQILGSTLTRLKEDLDFYYGEDSDEVTDGLDPEEQCNFRRRRVTRLCGLTLRNIFDLIIEEKGEENLLKAGQLLMENLKFNFKDAQDIQRLISINIALLRVNADNFIHIIRLSPLFHAGKEHNPLLCMVSLSRRLYELRETRHPIVTLEPYLFYVMFNWPRQNTNPNCHESPGVIGKAMLLWKDAYFKKYPRQSEQDRPYRKKDTCMFFFANGSEMRSIAYYEDIKGEMSQSSETFWKMPRVLRKLQRFQGTLRQDGEDVEMIIKHGEGNHATLTISTSFPIRNRTMWNKKVFFVIGFTWRCPKAYDVRLDDPTENVDYMVHDHQVKPPNPHLPSRVPDDLPKSKRTKIQNIQKSLTTIQSIKQRGARNKREHNMLKKEGKLVEEMKRLKADSSNQ